MNQKLQLLGVWSAAVFFALWLIGYGVFARWIPPTAPWLSAEAIAELFRADSVSIRIGMVFMTLGSVFYLPWTVILSILIRNIEGRSSFLAMTQLAAGIISTLTFFIPSYLWAAAAFRPERDPQITQMVVDIGWLIFITGIGPFILQYLCLAIAIFIDKRPVPAFPRWAAYLQIWISVSFLPAVFAFFMKTGPFAWNGLFVWWIPLTIFAVWFVAMIVLARKAVLGGAAEPAG